MLHRVIAKHLAMTANTGLQGKAEEILQNLIDGIDDLEAVERELSLDLRNMVALMRQLKHSSDEHHNGEDVLTHTIWVLSDLEELIESMDDERKLVLRRAALLHDTGKAYTHEVQPSGKHTFYGHAQKSVQIAEALLARHRKVLGALYQQVLDLVDKHDDFMRLLDARADAKDLRYLNKFMRGGIYMGGHLEDLVALVKADGNRSRVRNETLRDIDRILKDLVETERQNKAKAEAKVKFEENVARMLPQIRDFVVAEGFPEVAASTLAEINAILGKARRFDLLRRIKALLEGAVSP